MKIRITKVLPTSAHYGKEYDLVGCVGEVEEIKKAVHTVDDGSEYFGKEIYFVIIKNCKYPKPQELVYDGDERVILGAEFEVIEE